MLRSAVPGRPSPRDAPRAIGAPARGRAMYDTNVFTRVRTSPSRDVLGAVWAANGSRRVDRAGRDSPLSGSCLSIAEQQRQERPPRRLLSFKSSYAPRHITAIEEKGGVLPVAPRCPLSHGKRQRRSGSGRHLRDWLHRLFPNPPGVAAAGLTERRAARRREGPGDILGRVGSNRGGRHDQGRGAGRRQRGHTNV